MILILLKKYWRYLAVIIAIIGLVFWWDASVKKAYQKGRDDMTLEISNRLKEEAIKKAKEQRAQSEKYQDQKAEREESFRNGSKGHTMQTRCPQARNPVHSVA